MGGQQRIGQVHEAEGAAARSGHGWCRRARACTTLRRERPPADALCRRAGLGERGLAGMGLVRLRELAGMGRARLLARAVAAPAYWRALLRRKRPPAGARVHSFRRRARIVHAATHVGGVTGARHHADMAAACPARRGP